MDTKYKVKTSAMLDGVISTMFHTFDSEDEAMLFYNNVNALIVEAYDAEGAILQYRNLSNPPATPTDEAPE